MRSVFGALLLGLVAWAQVARADDGFSMDDPAGTDPLGEDPEVLPPAVPAAQPRSAAAASAGEREAPAPPSAIERATARTEIAFQDGLAIVDIRATFRGTSDTPSAVDERLPIPAGAVPVAVEACLGVAATDPAICRAGTLDLAPDHSASSDPGTPRAAVSVVALGARTLYDEAGDALRIVAWPARIGRALRVRVRVVLEAPVHGGVAAIRWPTPFVPPGGARPTIRVLSTGAVEPRVAGRDASHGPVPVDPGTDVDVSVRVPALRAPLATVLRAHCAAGPCARVRVEAPLRPATSALDVVVLIDRSASMQGVAPERVRAAVDAIVRLLPSGSRHHLVAFAARARALPGVSGAGPASDAAPSLGSSTRFDTAFAVAAQILESPAARPLVVVVGDGGLTDLGSSRSAFGEAALRGIEVSAVSLGDDAPSAALREGVRQTGGVIVELPSASRGGVDEAPPVLERRLSALFAPNVATDVRVRIGAGDVRLGALRAGEELAWIGRAPLGTVVGLHGVSESAALETADPSGEASRFLGARLRASSQARARGQVFPARDVLAILRTRLLPGARGCLRRDRAGRPGHAVRAVFELTFADRELDGADVTGPISPSLRDCLLEATESLEVPPFPGRLLVRYPVATRAEPVPAPQPLPAELDEQVQNVGSPSR